MSAEERPVFVLKAAGDLNGAAKTILEQGYAAGSLDREEIGYVLTLLHAQREKLEVLGTAVELPKPKPPAPPKRKRRRPATAGNVVPFPRPGGGAL